MVSSDSESPDNLEHKLANIENRLRQSERELQSIKLELEEKDRLLKAANANLQLQQTQSAAGFMDELARHDERLFEELAAPVAQIITQEHLQNKLRKSLEAADVLAVANRLVAVLLANGLETVGTFEESIPFDRNLHESLSLDDAMDTGELAVVKMVGLGYRGKVLRRAGVSRATSEETVRQ